MRFVSNLLPQLLKAGDTGDQGGGGVGRSNLSRVVSVLEAGGEAALHLDDLSLKTHYSLRSCAKHAITMNSVSMEHLAASYPQVSFVHSFPGVVRTRLDRDFGTLGKCALAVLMVIARPWEIPLDESGERHLYAATSHRFPPLVYRDHLRDAAEGSNGRTGSGFYRLSSTGATYQPSKVMEQYRVEGVGGKIWKHTLDVFAKVREGKEIES